ncbi:meckelin [Anabrus simplex]|uniref:meckelin n=1 Tax=Anabrus simplex TaxID=316456 RepID=UPI0035A3B3DC
MGWPAVVIISMMPFLSHAFSGEIFFYHDPTFCTENEYFSVLKINCMPCDAERNLEPTVDRLACTCNSRSKIIALDDTTGFPKCEACAANEYPTKDKMECLPCSIQDNVASSCKQCSSGQVWVERELNGSGSEMHCLNCTNGTIPSADGNVCIPCPVSQTVAGSRNCSCPSATHELLEDGCVPRDALVDWPNERNTFLIHYESGVKVDSYFFRKKLRSAIYLCKMKNHLACQMVANMCVMVMFQDNYKGSPCKLFQDSKHIPTSEGGHLPWLFYGEGDAQTVLSRKKIPTKYSLIFCFQNNQINLTVVHILPTGLYNGISTANGSFLQLCPGSWNILDMGLRFGSHYQHSCKIPANQLVSQRETEFFDLYLQYWEGGESILYAVPILTTNFKGGQSQDNQASDRSQWMLTRRFFFVDKVSGIKAVLENEKIEQDEMPSVVRYLKSCEIRVKVQNKEEEGRIYPPLMVVTYGEITRDDIDAGTLVTLHFSVKYEMTNSFQYSIEVAMGVLCALAAVWSCVETWSYSRRCGHMIIDIVTLARLALFACGNLANVFFLVVACASLYVFAFFKGQSIVQVLLPTSKDEALIRTYVITAFVLKIVEMIHLVWRQISIDIFFIDWERPRPRSSVRRPGAQAHPSSSDKQQLISIWRTYFIANEWNEIQTSRKVSLLFQLLTTTFLLKVMGIEHWATADPELHTDPAEYMAISPPSLVCRLAVGFLVYILVYFLQFLFVKGLYERYIKNKIQQFIDICSLANISVFILSLENFGYYVHGRSAHGFADTDMQTLLIQLQREEDDLCGHRGLLPGTDHQTFQMVVPLQLRSYYRKVMSPISSIMTSSKRLSTAGGGGGLRSKIASNDVDRSVQAYHSMNKFLSAYLEHALKDLDYDVKEKTFAESLLDIEFSEAFGRGIFYTDSGQSFDKVLFYGNEFTLASFDIMLFSFMEVIFQDYLIAIIVTALVAKLLVHVRKVGGRRNLARKTLIDERFLI